MGNVANKQTDRQADRQKDKQTNQCYWEKTLMSESVYGNS